MRGIQFLRLSLIALADAVNVFPLTESAMGGLLLSISGPCFDDFSSLECDFGGGLTSNAVFANSLRAYCPIPMLNKFGFIPLSISGTKQNTDEQISYPTHSLNASK